MCAIFPLCPISHSHCYCYYLGAQINDYLLSTSVPLSNCEKCIANDREKRPHGRLSKTAWKKQEDTWTERDGGKDMSLRVKLKQNRETHISYVSTFCSVVQLKGYGCCGQHTFITYFAFHSPISSFFPPRPSSVPRMSPLHFSNLFALFHFSPESSLSLPVNFPTFFLVPRLFGSLRRSFCPLEPESQIELKPDKKRA